MHVLRCDLHPRLHAAIRTRAGGGRLHLDATRYSHLAQGAYPGHNAGAVVDMMVQLPRWLMRQ